MKILFAVALVFMQMRFLSAGEQVLNLWSVADGYFDDPSSWSKGYVSSNCTQLSQWSFSSSTTPADRIVRFRDYDYTGDYLNITLNSGFAGSLTFDGADALFRYGAAADGDRSQWPGFVVIGDSPNLNKAIMSVKPGTKTHGVLSFSNVFAKVSYTTEQDASVVFGRGSVVFCGTNEVDAATGSGYVGIDADGVFPARNIDMSFTNVAVTATALNIGGRTTDKVCVDISGSQTSFTLCKYLYLGYNLSGAVQSGLDELRVSGGAQMIVNASRASSANGYCYIGETVQSFRTRRVVVDGEGSLFDASRSSLMRASSGGVFCVTNAGTIISCAGMYSADGVGSATGRIDVCKGGKLIAKGSSGSTCVIGSSGIGYMTLDGGSIECADDCPKKIFYLGQYASGFGTLAVLGGKMKLPVGSEIRVGLVGSGVMNVEGGEIVADKIGLATSEATGPTTNIFRQASGTITLTSNVGGISVSQGKDSRRTVKVILDGGQTSGMRIMGGGGVDVSPEAVSVLSADGGSFSGIAANSWNWPFVSGFARAELGEKGLTLNAKTFNQPITQRFTNKPGELGRLILCSEPNGQFEFRSNDSDNAELVVASTTAKFDAALTNWMTTVVVTNGSKLNLSATKKLSLSGLSIGDSVSFGNLIVGPETQISLSSISLPKAVLSLSGSFSADASYPLFFVKGELSPIQIQTVCSVPIDGSVPSGRFARIEASYDSEACETVFSLVFPVAVEPTEENVWTAAMQGGLKSWNDSANWSDGVPTSSSVVKLCASQTSPAGTVAVDDVATPLGALSFAGGDWVLAGEGTLFFVDWGGRAKIRVAEGTQRINVNISAPRGLDIVVADGAKLIFGGRVDTSAGMIEINSDKSRGVVEFAGPGSFAYSGFTHWNGTLAMFADKPFDALLPGSTFFFNGYGTLRFPGEATAEPYRLPFGLYFQGGSAGGSIWGSAEVLDNDRPIVVPPYRTSLVNGGCIVKRGEAQLVFEAAEGKRITVGQTNGKRGGNDFTTSPDRPMNIDEESGTTPSNLHSHGAINVLEGELVYRGVGESPAAPSNKEVSNPCTTFVGLRSTNDVTVAPGIVFDNVYADFGFANTSLFAVAESAILEDYPQSARRAYLCVSNNAVLRVGTLSLGAESVSGTYGDVSPCVYLEGAEIEASGAVILAAREGVSAAWNLGAGGRLFCGEEPVLWNGAVDMCLAADALFAADADLSPLGFSFGASAAGTLLVGEGAILCATGGVAEANAQALLAFDGGRLCVPDGATIDFPAAVSLEAREGGLFMDIPENETWTLADDVAGDGFVVLPGAGSLALSGVFSGGIAGGGNVVGGTLQSARIRAAYGDVTAAPTFADVSVAGRVTVELGTDAEVSWVKPYPSGIKVATFTGDIPSAECFRLSRYCGVSAETGRRITGVFTVDDGVVFVDVSDLPGTVMIVR